MSTMPPNMSELYQLPTKLSFLDTTEDVNLSSNGTFSGESSENDWSPAHSISDLADSTLEKNLLDMSVLLRCRAGSHHSSKDGPLKQTAGSQGDDSCEIQDLGASQKGSAGLCSRLVQGQSTSGSEMPTDYPDWLAGGGEEEEDASSPRQRSSPTLEDFPPAYPTCKGKPGECNACSTLITWLSLTSDQAEYHCLLCGNAFCDKCSSYWTMLPHMGYHDMQRTCKSCHMRATGNHRPQPSSPERRCSRRVSSPALSGWLQAKLFPFFLHPNPPFTPQNISMRAK